MVPTAWIYSIQFEFWPPQLHQHLHPHSTYHLVAELIHYLQICTSTNIHTYMTCTNYRIRATSTNKWPHHFVHASLYTTTLLGRWVDRHLAKQKHAVNIISRFGNEFYQAINRTGAVYRQLNLATTAKITTICTVTAIIHVNLREVVTLRFILQLFQKTTSGDEFFFSGIHHC